MPQNLPKDLGSQDPITSAKLKALWANLPLDMGMPQLNGLSLQKGNVVLQPDNSLKLILGHKGIGTDMRLGHLLLSGNVSPNSFSANGSYPLLGGMLRGNIMHGPDGNSYGIQYQRNF